MWILDKKLKAFKHLYYDNSKLLYHIQEFAVINWTQ